MFQNGLKNSDGQFDDTVKDPYYYLAEDSSIDAESGFNSLNERRTTEAIVHLSWFDFKLSQSATYANSLIDGEIGESVNNFYYKVERADNREFNNSEDLPGEIPLRKGIFLYHYVDYLIPKGGKKYFYRVNLWKSGTSLTFSSYDENGSEEKIINLRNSVLGLLRLHKTWHLFTEAW